MRAVKAAGATTQDFIRIENVPVGSFSENRHIPVITSGKHYERASEKY
jgi:hypothetical protein